MTLRSKCLRVLFQFKPACAFIWNFDSFRINCLKQFLLLQLWKKCSLSFFLFCNPSLETFNLLLALVRKFYCFFILNQTSWTLNNSSSCWLSPCWILLCANYLFDLICYFVNFKRLMLLHCTSVYLRRDEPPTVANTSLRTLIFWPLKWTIPVCVMDLWYNFLSLVSFVFSCKFADSSRAAN